MVLKSLKINVLSLLVLCSIGHTYAQSKSTLLKKAKTAFAGKHYDEAIANYLRVLEIDPQNTTAIWYTAQAYYNINCYGEAMRYYQKSTEVSQSENAYINLGGFSAQMGYDEIAQRALDKALEYNPQSTVVCITKGGNDVQYSRLESARENLNKGLAIDSTASGLYMNMSIVYALEGNEDERMRCLTIYTNLMPYNPSAWAGLADVKKKRKDKTYKADLERGIELCNKALKQNRYDKIILRRAQLYAQLGKNDLAQKDYKQALEIYDEAVKDVPDSWFMRFHRATVYQGLNEYDKAQADYEAVLEMNSLHPTVRKKLAELLKTK